MNRTSASRDTSACVLSNLSNKALDFVDVEKTEIQKDLRIAFRQEHQISIIYLLEGTLSHKIKRWIESQEEKHV